MPNRMRHLRARAQQNKQSQGAGKGGGDSQGQEKDMQASAVNERQAKQGRGGDGRRGWTRQTTQLELCAGNGDTNSNSPRSRTPDGRVDGGGRMEEWSWRETGSKEGP